MQQNTHVKNVTFTVTINTTMKNIYKPRNILETWKQIGNKKTAIFVLVGENIKLGLDCINTRKHAPTNQKKKTSP